MARLIDLTNQDEPSLEPGAGIEALKKRRSTVVPPSSQSKSVLEEKSSTRERQDLSPRSGVKTGSEPSKAEPRESGSAKLGQAKGKMRQVTVRVTPELHDELIARCDRDNRSRGVVVMDAVRSAHHDLRASHTPCLDDDSFAPIRVVVVRNEPGATTSLRFYVTPEESEALAALATDVSMSVSRVVAQCMTMAWD